MTTQEADMVLGERERDSERDVIHTSTPNSTGSCNSRTLFMIEVQFGVREGAHARVSRVLRSAMREDAQCFLQSMGVGEPP